MPSSTPRGGRWSVPICIPRGAWNELDHGYVPGVPAPDGDELDVYVLNIPEPLAYFSGMCIAVIHRLDDNDNKLVLVSPGQTATDEQIRAQTWFQEQYFESIIIRSKE